MSENNPNQEDDYEDLSESGISNLPGWYYKRASQYNLIVKAFGGDTHRGGRKLSGGKKSSIEYRINMD